MPTPQTPDPEMIEIGDPEKEIIFEPVPVTEPAPQEEPFYPNDPRRDPAPQPQREPEKVPAGLEEFWGDEYTADPYAAGLYS